MISWGGAKHCLHFLIKGRKYYWKEIPMSLEVFNENNIPLINLEGRNRHHCNDPKKIMYGCFYSFKESDLYV